MKAKCNKKANFQWKTQFICPYNTYLSQKAITMSPLYPSEKIKSFITRGKGFVYVSIGKQTWKLWKSPYSWFHESINWETKHEKFWRISFLTQKAERLRPKSLFRKNMIISFCIIFLKNLSRVMRHTKKGKIQGKTKNWKNHEGSYNLGKTFWNPKKLSI